VGGAELRLHADLVYDKHPWPPRLTRGERRGLGAGSRSFGAVPDAAERRARQAGAPLVQPATTKGHGRREAIGEDPDGYRWAAGAPTPDANPPPSGRRRGEGPWLTG
jgi:hypothetical protein